MEEDVSPGRNVFGFSAFDLVMADTVFTGDEDHSVGTTWLIWQASCPAPETISMLEKPSFSAALRTLPTHSGSKFTVGASQNQVNFGIQFFFPADFIHKITEFLIQSGKDLRIRMPHIDGEEYLPGMVLIELCWSSMVPTVTRAFSC